MKRYKSDVAYVNENNFSRFCSTNLHLFGGSSAQHRGIVLEFPGLGGGSCLGGSQDTGEYNGEYAEKLAAHGLILLYMFTGPWSWMNRGAVRMTDLTVDAVRARYLLANDSPLIATGGSMGGLSGLVYTADSVHRVTACAVTCPCVDAEAGMNVLESLPRTFISAVAAYDMPLEKAIRSVSPSSMLTRMPHVPYFVMSDCDDELFPVSDIDDYVSKLRSAGNSVEYIRMKNCRHGEFSPGARERLTEFVISAATE